MVAEAVVVAAGGAAVVLGGEPAGGVGVVVVELGVLGGFFAEGVVALAVADFDGAP